MIAHDGTLNDWAKGTSESLRRQIDIPARLRRLEQENAILREQLAQARQRIAELEQSVGADRDLPGAELRLVNQTEAAAILKVHPSAISRWCAAGHFKLHYSPHRAKPLIDAATLHRPKRKKRGASS